MTPKEWLEKNAVLNDKADIKEFETLVSDLDPLANIKTKEDALNFIDRNNLFKSGLDSAISKAVASHDEKFTADKLPDLLKAEREKAIKEANPEETPEQKRIRELEEIVKASGNKDKLNELKDSLRAKAKEIGYEGNIERYSRLSGEQAIDLLVSDHEAESKRFADYKETLQKEVYKGNPPPVKGEEENTDFNLDSEMGKLSFLNQ